MKFLGHPIHIMLIHFPTALLPMDFVCSLIYSFNNESSFLYASFYALIGGVLIGWLSLITGFIDLINVKQQKPLVQALTHGTLNTIVIIVFSALAYIQFKNHPKLQADSTEILILKAAIIGLLLLGNFFGGNLILKHKIGVKNEQGMDNQPTDQME